MEVPRKKESSGAQGGMPPPPQEQTTMSEPPRRCQVGRKSPEKGRKSQSKHRPLKRSVRFAVDVPHPGRFSFFLFCAPPARSTAPPPQGSLMRQPPWAARRRPPGAFLIGPPSWECRPVSFGPHSQKQLFSWPISAGDDNRASSAIEAIAEQNTRRRTSHRQEMGQGGARCFFPDFGLEIFHPQGLVRKRRRKKQRGEVRRPFGLRTARW